MVAVEIYIFLTKEETDRLKKVSAVKRKAAGREEEFKVFKQRLMHVVREEPEGVDMFLEKFGEPSLRTEARHRRGVKV